jgi:hypothetical protein
MFNQAWKGTSSERIGGFCCKKCGQQSAVKHTSRMSHKTNTHTHTHTHSPTGIIEAVCNGMTYTVVQPYTGVTPVGYPILS